MKEALEAIKDNKFEFQPECKVVSSSEFQGGLDLFSCHPASLYSLYFSKEGCEKLLTAVTTWPEDIRPFPGKTFAQEFPKLPDTEPKKTTSIVTTSSKHYASITPRCKSQNAVMNKIGAPTVGIYYSFFGIM